MAFSPIASEAHSATGAYQDIDAGIVVNYTTTFIGQNFYSTFIDAWSGMDINEQFTLTIKERATARYGSFMSIEYKGRVAFHSPISSVAKKHEVQRMAEIAAAQVFDFVMSAEMGSSLSSEVDLGEDELW